MRVVLVVSVLALVAVWAPPPRAVAQEAHARFLASCQAEALASWPDAPAEQVSAGCEERWPSVVRSNPLIDILLSPFVENLGPTITATDIRLRARLVRWGRTSPEGIEGRFGDVEVLVPVADRTRLVLRWGAVGELVPYDIPEALRLRGASVDMIGCYDFGATESNSVYRVHAPGHVPFAMTVYLREAPTASANSSLTITAATDRQIPDMAALRSEDPDADWKTDCA